MSGGYTHKSREPRDAYDPRLENREYETRAYTRYENRDGKDLEADILRAEINTPAAEGPTKLDGQPTLMTDMISGAEGDYVSGGAPVAIPKNEHACIEFPGRVDNVENAVKLIGGRWWLGRALSGDTRFTRLTFRPAAERPNPAFCHTKRVGGLLLRVRTPRGHGQAAGGKATSRPLEVRVRAVVYQNIQFNSLADFQYLPPPGLTKTSSSLANVQNLLQLAKPGQKKMWEKEPLHLPPLLFSRVDKPLDYQFRENPYSRRAVFHMPDGSVQHHRVLSNEHSRQSTQQVLSWLDRDIPTRPIPLAIEQLRRSESALEILPKIRELFERRPVWSKTTLCIALSPQLMDITNLLRNLLPVVSYSYGNGPYRRLYIRYGFDVRAPPKDGAVHPALYEYCDLRTGRNTGAQLQANAHGLLPQVWDLAQPVRQQTILSGRAGWPTAQDRLFTDRLPMSWENLFMLMASGGPRPAGGLHKRRQIVVARTLIVQYCDFDDPALLAEIQRVASKEAATTKRACGWLSSKTMAVIRANITSKYTTWFMAFTKGKTLAQGPLNVQRLLAANEGEDEDNKDENDGEGDDEDVVVEGADEMMLLDDMPAIADDEGYDDASINGMADDDGVDDGTSGWA